MRPLAAAGLTAVCAPPAWAGWNEGTYSIELGGPIAIAVMTLSAAPFALLGYVLGRKQMPRAVKVGSVFLGLVVVGLIGAIMALYGDLSMLLPLLGLVAAVPAWIAFVAGSRLGTKHAKKGGLA